MKREYPKDWWDIFGWYRVKGYDFIKDKTKRDPPTSWWDIYANPEMRGYSWEEILEATGYDEETIYNAKLDANTKISQTRYLLGCTLTILSIYFLFYVGIWSIFIGGILRIIEAFQNHSLTVILLAWSLIKIFVSSLVNYVLFICLVVSGGWLVGTYEIDYGPRLTRRKFKSINGLGYYWT